MLRFGSWITVSGIISPFLVRADRFVIASMGVLADVGYYAPPHDSLTRLGVLPGGISVAYFPSATRALAVPGREFIQQTRHAMLMIVLALGPLILGVILLARPLLASWLGSDFAARSTQVSQLLAAGVFINGLAQIPVAILHAVNRPDIPAYLHLVELPVFLLVLILTIGSYGIMGAAGAWVGRVAIDALFLWLFAWKSLARREIRFPKSPLIVLAASCVAMVVCAAVPAWHTALGSAALIGTTAYAFGKRTGA
jgi:O-antigen/teichoic acid export membrane protein